MQTSLMESGRADVPARVAIAAIDAVVTHVMLMTELNGCWRSMSRQCSSRTVDADADEHRATKRRWRQARGGARICAVSKYLGIAAEDSKWHRLYL